MDVNMTLKGYLEIDTARGVIHFHNRFEGTILRIYNIHEDNLKNLNFIDLSMGYHKGRIDHNSVRKTDTTLEKNQE